MVEKHCGQNTPLPDTSLDFEQNVTVTNRTGKVAVETCDDLDEVGGDSYARRIRQRLSR